MNPTNLVFIASWHDIIALETCIKAVAYKNNNVNYYVINADISQEWFYQFNKLLKPLHSQVIDKKVNAYDYQRQGNLPQIAEAKLLLPNILKDIDKVLYLSLNTLVIGKLDHLYSMPLTDKMWTGRQGDNHQLNTDVMLMNLALLRQNAKVTAMQQYWDQHQLVSGTQSLFNDFLGNVGQIISDSGIIKQVDDPWMDEISSDNQYWWQLFATDWPAIQTHQPLNDPSDDLTHDESTNQPNKMNFILVANYAYQNVFLTTLKSLLYYNHHINIFLVNPDIPTTWFKTINHLISPSRLIDIKISPDKLNIMDVSSKLGHVNNMTNALLYLHEIIPASRAIYLDSDLVVNRNLQPLYDLNLQNHPFAAVPELIEPRDKPVINVGMMLMDLDHLRSIPDLTNKMIDYYQTHDFDIASESVISHFFLDSYLKLEQICNYQVGREMTFWRFHNFNELDKHLFHCFTVHYTGDDKPWALLSYTRHRELWWAFHDLTWDDITNHSPLTMHPHFSSPFRVMICTGDQNIEHFEKIVQALPEVEFNVTAHTFVAWNLVRMTQYPNVHVFHSVLSPIQNRLAAISNVVLDIGYGSKDEDFLQAVLDDGRQVMSFSSVQDHNLTDRPNYSVFKDSDINQFINELRKRVVYSDLAD